MIVLIDLVRSRIPEHVNSVDTVPNYWTKTRTDTKLTSMHFGSKIELR